MIGWRRLCARQEVERWRWLGGVNGLLVRKGMHHTFHVFSSDLTCGMVVTGTLSLLPIVFNCARQRVRVNGDVGEGAMGTDRLRERPASYRSFDLVGSQ